MRSGSRRGKLKLKIKCSKNEENEWMNEWTNEWVSEWKKIFSISSEKKNVYMRKRQAVEIKNLKQLACENCVLALVGCDVFVSVGGVIVC